MWVLNHWTYIVSFFLLIGWFNSSNSWRRSQFFILLYFFVYNYLCSFFIFIFISLLDITRHSIDWPIMTMPSCKSSIWWILQKKFAFWDGFFYLKKLKFHPKTFLDKFCLLNQLSQKLLYKGFLRWKFCSIAKKYPSEMGKVPSKNNFTVRTLLHE